MTTTSQPETLAHAEKTGAEAPLDVTLLLLANFWCAFAFARSLPLSAHVTVAHSDKERERAVSREDVFLAVARLQSARKATFESGAASSAAKALRSYGMEPAPIMQAECSGADCYGLGVRLTFLLFSLTVRVRLAHCSLRSFSTSFSTPRTSARCSSCSCVRSTPLFVRSHRC